MLCRGRGPPFEDPNDVANFTELGKWEDPIKLRMRSAGFQSLRRMAFAHRGRMPPRSEPSSTNLVTPRSAFAPSSASGDRSLCYGDPRFSAQQPTPASVRKESDHRRMGPGSATVHPSAREDSKSRHEMVGRKANLSPRRGSPPRSPREDSRMCAQGTLRSDLEAAFDASATGGRPLSAAKIRRGMPARAIRVDGSVVRTSPSLVGSAAHERLITGAAVESPRDEGLAGSQTSTSNRLPVGRARSAQGQQQAYALNVRSIAPIGEGVTPTAWQENPLDDGLPPQFKLKPVSGRLDHLGKPKRAASGLILRGSHGGMCNLGTPHRAEAAPPAPAQPPPLRTAVSPRRAATAPAGVDDKRARSSPRVGDSNVVQTTHADELVRVLKAFQPPLPQF